jgi:hypothetical protein
MADYIMNGVALRAGAGGFAMKFSIVAIGKGIGTIRRNRVRRCMRMRASLTRGACQQGENRFDLFR